MHSAKYFPAGTVGVASVLTIPNPATAHVMTGNTINFNGSGAQTIPATAANFIYNNLTLSNGISKSAGGAITVTSMLTVGNSITFDGLTNNITLNGNIANSGSIAGSGAGAVVLSGGSSAHILSGGGSYRNMTINDANGATLSGSVTIGGTLTLTSGIISAASDTVIISLGAAVSRTNGYINGYLRKAIATGNSTVTYEIGDATNYTPVSVQFYNTINSGSLVGRTIASEHPDISNSPVEGANDVNRYWRFRRNGLAFDSAWATLNYVAGDLDQPGSELTFVAGKLDGGYMDCSYDGNTHDDIGSSAITNKFR